MALKHCPDGCVVVPVCCDTRPSEHPDNYRFSQECEKWFGVPIAYIRTKKGYETVDDVFEKERYMSGQYGARCTTELKKLPRMVFAQADDIHVWGFCANERKRIKDFKANNPDMRNWFILQDLDITHSMCLNMISEAWIELPKMYRIFDDEDKERYKQGGFDNNNCPGCVKASSPWYWSMIRKYFPDVFERRARQSREIGCRLVEISHHKRIFLDELPDRVFKKKKKKEKTSCGPDCGVAPRILTNKNLESRVSIVVSRNLLPVVSSRGKALPSG
jgi:hypothetical protein